MAESEPDPDDIVAQLRRKAEEIARQVSHALRDVTDTAQVEFEKAGAKFIAEHPDLYAELRKTAKQLERTARQAAKELGFDQGDERRRSSK